MKRKLSISPEVIKNEELEDNYISKIDNLKFELANQKSEQMVKPAISITPIVFSEELGNNIINHTPLDIPLNFFAYRNLEMIKNGYWDDLSVSSLNALNVNNLRLVTDLITDFIIQNSFVNICNFVDHSELVKRGYGDFFNIKQFIQDELYRSTHTIYSFIENIATSYYTDQKNSFSSLSILNEEDSQKNIDSTINYISVLADQITVIVMNDICIGIDKAINDVVLQTHIIPNIDILLNKLYHDDEFLSSKSINKLNINTYASIYLKTLLNDNIVKLNKVISDTIHTILLNDLPSTFYYGISDHINYSKNQKDNDNNIFLLK